jgi:hypothetical protein
MSGMELSSCACDILTDSKCVQSFRTVKRKSRKNRKCMECGCDIRKGEHYYDNRYICADDTGWQIMRNCIQCQQIRIDYGCGAIGWLSDAIFEKLGVRING